MTNWKAYSIQRNRGLGAGNSWRPKFAAAIFAVMSSVATAAFADVVTVDFLDKGSVGRSCTSFPSCQIVRFSQNANDQATKVLQVPVAASRPYFIFDLSHIAGTVLSASFQVEVTPTVSSGEIDLFDVVTPLTFFNSSGSEDRSAFGGPAGPIEQVFNDLGGGVQFGSFNAPQAGSLSVGLNLDALAAIQGSLGGQFAIGLSTTSTLAADLAKGSLALNVVVPLPSSIVLFAISVIGMSGWRRRSLPRIP